MVKARTPVIALVALAGIGCIRPSDEYDVRVHSAGIPLDDVQVAAEPMGGRIELARFRLHGSNLGHGVTGTFSDMPRADGTQFAIGAATFATPRAAEFDRNSAFVHPGPPVAAGEDACSTRIGRIDSQGFSEYVDVGIGWSSKGRKVRCSVSGATRCTTRVQPARAGTWATEGSWSR